MLAPYDFTIHHRPGDRNPANGPSQRPNYIHQIGIETENNPALNHLLPTLTSKLVNQHKLNAEQSQIPITGQKTQESSQLERKTRKDIPTVGREVPNNRRVCQTTADTRI